jgi:hypothetical protein
MHEPGPIVRRLAALAIALAAVPGPASAQVIVRDIQPVSMQFRSLAQESILVHQAQVRSRQVRVRQAPLEPVPMPRFANGLSMSGDEGSIPLRLRDEPPPPARLASNTAGVMNAFILGDLHTDHDGGSTPGLSTSGLAAGADYRVSDELLLGVASGLVRTGAGSGSMLSAYLTFEPVQRVFLDMSVSYSAHRTRKLEAISAISPPSPQQPSIDGASRSFSMTLNHPRQTGAWNLMPYGRYDRIVTGADTGPSSASPGPIDFDLTTVSLGSTAATIWGTPLGSVRPALLVELQREVVTVAGAQLNEPHTQGVVGFGLTTRVTRGLAAFAESRYQATLDTMVDRKLLVGLRSAR